MIINRISHAKIKIIIFISNSECKQIMRWKVENSITFDYYYDEEIFTHMLKKTNDLSLFLSKMNFANV